MRIRPKCFVTDVRLSRFGDKSFSAVGILNRGFCQQDVGSLARAYFTKEALCFQNIEAAAKSFEFFEECISKSVGAVGE